MTHNKDKGTSVGFSEKYISLTEKQIWFIKCALDARCAVLPLDKKQLNPKIFEHDYGFTQKEIIEELYDLKLKLKFL